jgi:hypothetical protein
MFIRFPSTFLAVLAALALWSRAGLSAEIALKISTSADGAGIHQGQVLTIVWEAVSAPAGASVVLQLQKVATGRLFPIKADLPVSGQFSWKVPIFVVRPIMCARDASGACVSDINPNTTYRIVGTLKIPGPGSGLSGVVQGSSGYFTMLEASARRP